VLKSLGRSDEEINALFADGVVYDKYREREAIVSREP
jgi:hypothetical protein